MAGRDRDLALYQCGELRGVSEWIKVKLCCIIKIFYVSGTGVIVGSVCQR